LKKEKRYNNTKFSQEAIQQAWDKMYFNLSEKDKKIEFSILQVKLKDERWEYDTEPEFYADYQKDSRFAYFMKRTLYGKYILAIVYDPPWTDISITAPERSIIETIHQVFSNWAPKCSLPEGTEPSDKFPIVFIGHGHSGQWRDLKDHLQDKHGYKIEAYEVGARAGHAIRDILEDMMEKSSIAVLVLTGEDRDEDGNLHARENVIHELGLFQGRLGFPHAIILLEEGTSEFSNIHGVQQIRYSRNNIKETFGEILATLKREFDKDNE